MTTSSGMVDERTSKITTTKIRKRQDELLFPAAHALLHHHNYPEGKHCEILSRLGYKGGINVKSYFFFQKGLLYS